MRMKIILLLALLIFSTGIGLSKEPDWLIKMKQIKLLSDNRSDVVRLLGNPVENKKESDVWYYDFPEGYMTISFEMRSCNTQSANSGNWDVPKWTAVETDFHLWERVSPQKLNLTFKGFTRESVHDVVGAVIYHNDELGIDYVALNSQIEGITFRPEEKYNHLQCK